MLNVTRTLMAVAAIAALMLSTGCKSDCEKAVDNVFSLMEGEGDKLEGDAKEAFTKRIEEMKGKRDELVKECGEEKPEQAKCSMEAKSMKDLGACKKGK